MEILRFFAEIPGRLLVHIAPYVPGLRHYIIRRRFPDGLRVRIRDIGEEYRVLEYINIATGEIHMCRKIDWESGFDLILLHQERRHLVRYLRDAGVSVIDIETKEDDISDDDC